MLCLLQVFSSQQSQGLWSNCKSAKCNVRVWRTLQVRTLPKKKVWYLSGEEYRAGPLPRDFSVIKRGLFFTVEPVYSSKKFLFAYPPYQQNNVISCNHRNEQLPLFLLQRNSACCQNKEKQRRRFDPPSEEHTCKISFCLSREVTKEKSTGQKKRKPSNPLQYSVHAIDHLKFQPAVIEPTSQHYQVFTRLF